MKRKLLIGIALAFSTLGFAQKTTYHFQDTQARATDAVTHAYVKPMTVELQILTTKHKEWTISLTNQEIEQMKGDLPNIRSYAIYKISKDENCDVIVAPTINIKSNDTGAGFTVNVIGFPANFINWKTASQSDYEWIRMEQTQTSSNREVNAIIRQ